MASWTPRALFALQNLTQRFSLTRKVRPGSALTAAALGVLALSPAIARAQDVFAGGDSLQVGTFSDSYSSSCIAAQKPTVWKQAGVNPLTCHAGQGLQNPQGGCTIYGPGATVVAHVGTQCYYCSPNDPPGQIYIPMDQVQNAGTQGFLCGDPGIDPGCMAVCSRQTNGGPYVPPPGTTTVSIPPPAKNTATTGGGGTPLTATISNDPCHPNYDMSTAAGRAEAQANAAKDKAACDESLCQHNPQLDACKTVNLQASTSGGGGPAQAQMIEGLNVAQPCSDDTRYGAGGWSPQSIAALKAAVNNAKQTLIKAATYTDPPTWDAKTLKQAQIWYGNSSPATQQTIRNNIHGALKLVQSINLDNLSSTFYPGNQQDLAPYQQGAVAYVLNSLIGESSPTIFLMAPFWTAPATGPSSQGTVVMHEVSHYTLGGGTGDWAYGEGDCKAQVQVGPALPPIALANLGVITTLELVAPQLHMIPGYTAFLDHGWGLNVKWLTGTAAISNADSFSYFVYYVALHQ